MDPENTSTIEGITNTGDIVWLDANSVPDTTTASTITIDFSDVALDTCNIITETQVDMLWENSMPDPQTLKKMCEQYPALEKAYENFRAVYAMVEQDWKGNHEDDEPIF